VNDAEYNIYVDWNNDGDFSDTNENISGYVLAGDDLNVKYGRDGERSLSAVSAGSVELVLDNRDGRFSPDNASSPLYGMLVPGRPVKIETVHLGVTRTMFLGYIDDFELEADKYTGTCKLTVLDMLNKLAGGKISTPIYPSLQTGEAVNVVLDAIGWPSADRDVDSGATTLRWWFGEGENALEVLQSIIESEGPPSVVYVDGTTFVFKDRHHRYVNAASTTSQATFRGSGSEPLFSAPMTYNIGWKDLVNQVTIQVEETLPDVYSEVFSSEDTIALKAGETRTIIIDVAEGFVDLIPPEEGVDYEVPVGSVTAGISRTSGGTANLELVATADVVIQGLSVRGRQIVAKNTQNIQHNDVASQDEHGIRVLDDQELELSANVHDAWAIENIIIAQRATRRPVVSITVNNGNDTRFTQILTRQISDRIRIIEPLQTFVDHEFFIEKIEHSVAQAGKDHRVIFSCERAPDDTTDPDPPVPFEFGSATAGLNEGAFYDAGTSFTESILILDDATRGQLGSNGLAW
jgi:hypothetical protein